MTDAPKPCDLHLDLVKFRLPHFTESLRRQRKIKVVAIGSSSTAGEDDVIPFPPRLELSLRKRFPDRMIDVLNRGIGGQEAPEELSRFEPDVIAEAPTLVIWQVGTNAIYHRTLYDPHRVAGTIATGLSWLKGLAIDVILMDPQ
jgi:acyl-CoA thioesterase I